MKTRYQIICYAKKRGFYGGPVFATKDEAVVAFYRTHKACHIKAISGQS